MGSERNSYLKNKNPARKSEDGTEDRTENEF